MPGRADGLCRRPRKGRHEFGKIGVAFDPMESAFDMQQGGGGPAGELVGFETPVRNLGGLPPIVAHYVFDSVGRKE